MNTTQKGDYACSLFDAEATKRGVIVSKPISEVRYDRIIDIDGELKKIQVKYADFSSKKSSGSYSIKTSTTIKPKSHKGNAKYIAKKYTENEIDAIVAWLPAAEKFVWIGASEISNQTIITLRLKPAKNGQVKGCKFVKDYLW